MDFDVVVAALPAFASCPPDCFIVKQFLSILMIITKPPPDPLVDVRHRLCTGEPGVWQGRDIFCMFSDHSYGFYEITGESLETFLDLVQKITNAMGRKMTGHNLSPKNRTLLFMIWLRCYPSYNFLSQLFDVSTTTIHEEIDQLMPAFHAVANSFITWPSVDEWRDMIHIWPKLPNAVGAIDRTSVEIYCPRTEPQRPYYSGHRKYHALHAQIIIDNSGLICHLESGFLGHQNDAQQYSLMSYKIGRDLPFPLDCFILGDKIYPNRYPIITPFSQHQIVTRNHQEQRKRRKFNKIVSSYRTLVERTICKLKKYKILSSVWRHPRTKLAYVVDIVEGLVCRQYHL